MWLYVPNLSTSSPSAPEAAGSISESNWRFPALAQSVWWRGKPSPSRTWWQRWNRVSWLRHLCGVMPEPSTADAGVDAWTASLAASRASLIALPGVSREASTIAISGQPRGASSSSPASGSSSSRTSKACSRPGMTKSLEPKGFGETYASLVSRWREDCSRRRKLARAMSVSASSSSAWRTPTSGSENQLRGNGQTVHGAFQRVEAGHTLNLQDQVALWYTPNVPNGGRTLGEGTSPTGVTADGVKRQVGLENQARWWSTPRSSDGEKDGPNQAFGAGGIPLPAQSVDVQAYIDSNTWPTPTAMNRPRSEETLEKARAVRKEKAGQNTVPLYLEDLVVRYSPQDPLTSTDGVEPSTERRSLNPLFVEWLMGWPPGWTLLVSTDFACSATELCRFKQRMRSALSAIALPAEAPPAQLALFG